MGQILLVLKGLPASGKSTYANELIDFNDGRYKRVNKDSLRAMIDNGHWSKLREKIIIETEEVLVRKFLSQGYNVIVDDTNFGWEDKWKQVAGECGATFHTKEFSVYPEECVRRDALRGEKSVGADVIWKMYRKYVQPLIKKPVILPELPNAYIFDIDGTLAIMKDRSPFDWSRVGEDDINKDVARCLAHLQSNGAQIIILSGRDAVCKEETMKWLNKWFVSYDHLWMRAEGDNRKDDIVKKELYENNIAGKFNVYGVFDDRNQVVSLWRSLGLTCFQVAEGNF